MNRILRCLLLALAVSALPACQTMRAVDEHVTFDPSTGPVVYRDQWVRRSTPEVHVQPREVATLAPKVLFIPFRVTQPMENPGMAGYSVSRVIWQTWMSMQLFPYMEFSGEPTPYRRDVAVQLGRLRGADMVVGGFVTYLYAGGTAGESQVAVQVEAHDVHSGLLVWSISQSGLMPAEKSHDYFLFTTKTRLPSDPVQAIARSIAIDTGKIVQNWTAGPLPDPDRNSLDRRVHDAVFLDRDQVPPPRQPASERRSAF